MLSCAKCLLMICVILATAASAGAQDTYVVHGTQIVEQGPGYRSRAGREPSLFGYGYRGFVAGAVAGLGTGYLVARPGGMRDDDLRTLGFGAAAGALTGATLGITLGLLDRTGARSGHYVSRDLGYGVGFGVLLGATAGGLSAILSHDAEHVLFGAAIGSVAGLTLGLVTGVLESSLRDDPRQRSYGARRLRVTAAQASVSQSWVPAIVGTF